MAPAAGTWLPAAAVVGFGGLPEQAPTAITVTTSSTLSIFRIMFTPSIPKTCTTSGYGRVKGAQTGSRTSAPSARSRCEVSPSTDTRCRMLWPPSMPE